MPPDVFAHGYALLIGVSDSLVPEWRLQGVAKDIAALQKILTDPERCAYDPENVRVIQAQDATRDNILAGLDWLKDKLQADASDNETAVIFYSGHGFQDRSLTPPVHYLVPYDVVQGKLRRTGLRADDFAREIQEISPRRLLVLLDCCHAEGMEIKGLEDLAPAQLPLEQFLSQEAAKSADDLQAGSGAAPPAGFAGLSGGAGRVVLNSSRRDEKSYMLAGQEMSLFTYHILRALTGHAPHDPADREVSTAALLDYVWRQVPPAAEKMGHQQHPDGKVVGNFPVALLIGGKGIDPEEAPDPLVDAAQVIAQVTIYDQRAQIIEGPQTNIAGGARDVYSGQTSIVNINLNSSERLIQELITRLPANSPLVKELDEFSYHLNRFRFFHELLYEWKQLHNLLNGLLNDMGQFAEFVMKLQKQETPPDYWDLRKCWSPVSRKIEALLDWAKSDMKFTGLCSSESQLNNLLNLPEADLKQIQPVRLVVTDEVAKGPVWAVNLYNCWKRLEELFDTPEQLENPTAWKANRFELGDAEDELESSAETHMLITDQNLLLTADSLKTLSEKVLGK